MPFTLDIIPHVPSLDMYGNARPGTAYSLSGELVLTLSSSHPLIFGAVNNNNSAPSTTSRPTTVFLSSLRLTFEGRVEVLSNNCGYAPFRLCQVEKELVTGKPVMLTNRGQQNGVMRWTMTFDLAVPGWLPMSSSLDDQGSGTSYSLHAEAKFADEFDTARSAMSASASSASNSAAPTPAVSRPSTPFGSASGSVPYLPSSVSLSSLSAALNPFSFITRSKLRHAQATPVTIKVNRFRSPKSLNPFGGAPDFNSPLLPPQIYHPTPSLFPVTLESVETRVHMLAAGEDAAKKIPFDILSGIEVVAGVPEFIGLNEEKVPLSLRVRSCNPSTVNKGLVLEAFDVEIEQSEKFRSIPCERFISTFPVPPPSQQPPQKPFLLQNPLEGLYSLGLAASHEPVQWTRTVPMLPSKRVNFRPSPATGGLEVDGEWAKMDLAINVLRQCDREPESTDENAEGADKDEEKAGRNLRRKLLQADFDTPFCRVRHEMKIALKLSWLPEEAATSIASQHAHLSSSVSVGEVLRKARMAHPDRKTETLLISLPIKMTQVSAGVETIYKSLGVHHGAPLAPAMRRTLAQSRSTSPVPSLSASNSTSSTRTSPASAIVSLPSAVALLAPPRSDSPGPSGMTPSSSASSASSHSDATSMSSSLSVSPSSGSAPLASWTTFPGSFVLPPYSELYHTNGERKVCESTWLPRYVEKEEYPFAGEDEQNLDVGLALQV
ncbi:hypothetical protein FRB99_007582 [Tulasnella sp. 403]|nr:hypothetical protein FRB99_007582 [Tulasnella sp. 403]